MRVNRPQCARVPYSAESLVRVEASWYGRTLRAIPEVLSQVGYQQADHGESLLTSHHCCLGAAEGRGRDGSVRRRARCRDCWIAGRRPAPPTRPASGTILTACIWPQSGSPRWRNTTPRHWPRFIQQAVEAPDATALTLADIERWDPTAIRTVFRPRSTARTAHAPHRRRGVTPWGCSALAVRPPRRHR